MFSVVLRQYAYSHRPGYPSAGIGIDFLLPIKKFPVKNFHINNFHIGNRNYSGKAESG